MIELILSIIAVVGIFVVIGLLVYMIWFKKGITESFNDFFRKEHHIHKNIKEKFEGEETTTPLPLIDNPTLTPTETPTETQAPTETQSPTEETEIPEETEPPKPINRFASNKFLDEIFLKQVSYKDVTDEELQTILNLPIMTPSEDNKMSEYYSKLSLNDIYKLTPDELAQKTSYLAQLYFYLEFPMLVKFQDPDSGNLKIVFQPVSTTQKQKVLKIFDENKNLPLLEKIAIVNELYETKFTTLSEEVTKMIQSFVLPYKNNKSGALKYPLMKDYMYGENSIRCV